MLCFCVCLPIHLGFKDRIPESNTMVVKEGQPRDQASVSKNVVKGIPRRTKPLDFNTSNK